MRFSRARIIEGLVLVVIVIFAFVFWPKSADQVDTTIYKVVPFNIYDGDTFHAMVNGTDERVRVTGINAPEMDDPNYGAEAIQAKDFTASLIDGKTVWLEVDKGAERDQYGRLLAYVWLVDPTALSDKSKQVAENTLNGRLASEGYAKALTIKPNTTYADVFESLANQAKKDSQGLWPSGVFS